MSKTKRIIRIMLALNNNASITSKELAEIEGVSERTIMRDIQELSEIHFPVYSQRGRHGGFATLENKMIPPIWFSEGEIIALYFAINAIQYISSTPFSSNYHEILNKVLNLIPQKTTELLTETKNKVLMWQPSIKVDETQLKDIYQASLENKTVTILYESNDGEKYREIEPLGLYLSNGYWFCPAYCRLREMYRLFRVERIKETAITTNTSSNHQYSNVRDWIYSEYDSKGIVLKVKLSVEGRRKANGIHWLREDIISHSNGNFLIEKEISDSEVSFYVDLIWGLGAEAEVISPLTIKERIIKRASDLFNSYID